jgi:hypothetical protein
VAGVGDFNGDGKSDILWRNASTGEVDMWLMNGLASTASVPLLAAPSWVVAGVGDYNGDGKSDILWRNTTTGQVDEWQMNGASQTGSVTLLTSTAWAPVASLLHSG